MPSKNIIKQYREGGYYHIYNRGVEKRIIFEDKSDYTVFLHYLKLYLSPIEELKKDTKLLLRKDKIIKQNLSNEVNLLAFALMPNHIHLIIHQSSSTGIIKLMRRLSTAYAMYFNKKYKRIGPLFQSKYKAVLIENENYLLHLSRYIHLNPMKYSSTTKLIELSSYPYYLGYKKATWLKSYLIINYFKSNRKENSQINSYQSFVEENNFNSEEFIQDLILEED